MDSQLRTIVLLAVVGLAVYYLLPSENSQVESNVDVPEVVDEESHQEQAEVPVDVNESTLAPVDIADTTSAVADAEPVEATTQDEDELTGLEAEGNGASLDTAFMGAVPPNTAVDQVDFNRNNVEEYDSTQFLPQETNDEWFETDFTKAKYNLNNDKMINTDRYMIGVNTVGQSLKNPAYDIRGTIPNPKYTVSPWNNSTYEPDTNIKALY